MFIPNTSFLFGMAHYSIRIDGSTNKRGMFQYFEVKTTSWKAMDLPQSRSRSILAAA